MYYCQKDGKKVCLRKGKELKTFAKHKKEGSYDFNGFNIMRAICIFHWETIKVSVSRIDEFLMKKYQLVKECS